MIVDSSAIVAVIKDEPDADEIIRLLVDATGTTMSAATYVETAVVVDGARNPVASRRLDELLEAMAIDVVPFTPRQAGIARRAYADYGKGSGHPAGLNLGDCFAYALASDTREPLLFKGHDFGHTDITPAR